MQLDLTGLRIEVTDAYRDFTERKIKKLEKFFEPDTICHVTFSDKSKGKHHIDIRIELITNIIPNLLHNIFFIITPSLHLL